MADNLDKYYKLHHPEFLSEGMQVLREYIFYCNFDFIELCQRYDQFKDGTIQEKVLRDVLIEVSKTQFYFTDFNIANILKEAPYSSNRNIDYKELHKFLTECTPPKNSFHVFKNAVLKQKQNSASNKLFLEEIQKLFEEEVSNYFDRKAIYDFKHFNLNMLDLELLSSNAINIYFDDPIQEKMSKFSQHNNELILENFEILIAKKFSLQALPQLAFQFIAPDRIEMALYDFFGVRKTQKMFPFLMKDAFHQLLKVKIYNVEMTYDEKSLLYYLIWKKNQFGEFTIQTLIKWIIEMRPLHFKELIKLYDSKQPQLELLQLPKIFRELQDMAVQYSTNMLEQAFKPFSDNGFCTIENLKIVIRSLEIGHSQLDFNEFRYYLANHGLFGLSKQQQLLLKVSEFLSTLAPEQVKLETGEMTDTEKAYQTFFQSIMLSILQRYDDKAQKIMQADQMIDEIQLRKIFTEELTLVDQNSLTIIIQSLEHNIEPSLKQPLRMIYFPEIIDKLKARFSDNVRLPQPALVTIDKPETQDLLADFNYEEGQFMRDPDKAFAIKPLDDREVLEKLKQNLYSHFKIQDSSEFRRAETAVSQFCNYLQQFDKLRIGNLQKEILFEILQDITKLNVQEINNIIDFAMGVSKVDEDQFSFMFFCVQLNQFYQKHQLIMSKK